jgi:hypothetical protein
MLERIRMKQREVGESKNLMGKINRNLEIARLYRQCSNSMSSNKNSGSELHKKREGSVQSVTEVMPHNKLKDYLESKLSFVD